MIQRSLPRAQQSHDPLSSRPYSGVFLRNVPIPLLPLNPTTVSASPASPPISPPPTTGYPALDLHPNSILFASPSKQRCRPIQSAELKPHNIPVPPPPLPPSRTTPSPLPLIKSNLPPRKRFAFIPLLDSTTASPTQDPFSEPESCYNSDTDCSLFASDTEFSTPSLTTASLASSSPPESPASSNTTSPNLECDYPEEAFILNSDVDPDVDDAPAEHSYYPHMHNSMRGPTRDKMSMPTSDGPMSNFFPRRTSSVPSPIDLGTMEVKPLDAPMKPVGPPRKRFTIPIVALAESPSSSLGMGGCEYPHLWAGSDGQGNSLGQGNGQRQKSPSRCQ